jgi:endonuclease YncB( thermonuclease family)
MLTTTLLALLIAAAPAPPAEATLTEVIDGDTIEVETSGATEQVRLIGIDAPESGTCEAAAAAVRLTELLSADPVIVPGATDDRDRYDRILRYAHVAVDPAVDNDGTPDGMLDVGAALVAEGYAIARYDSRDGYGLHDRESTYIALDAASPPFACTAEQLAVFAVPTTTQPSANVAAAPEPEPQQENVFYQNCDAVRAAGADPIHAGDPGWQSKFDRDNDGVGCE